MNIRDRSDVSASLASWRRKEDYRRAKWKAATKGTAARAKWFGLLKTAKWYVARREGQLARLNPKARVVRLGAVVDNRFGGLGMITGVIGHYTAGPRDKNDADALRLWRQYHAQHRAQGWGGIGYHYGITAAGSIVLLRPVGMKGAHTAGANTGKVGVVMHGTTGDKPTAAQAEAVRWLAKYAHTEAMPAAHRTPRPLSGVPWYGHNDFNATGCPGAFKTVYVSKGERR